MIGEGVDFIDGDVRGLANEVVILRQEQHTVAFLPLSHRDARAIPVPVLGLKNNKGHPKLRRNVPRLVYLRRSGMGRGVRRG